MLNKFNLEEAVIIRNYLKNISTSTIEEALFDIETRIVDEVCGTYEQNKLVNEEQFVPNTTGKLAKVQEISVEEDNLLPEVTELEPTIEPIVEAPVESSVEFNIVTDTEVAINGKTSDTAFDIEVEEDKLIDTETIHNDLDNEPYVSSLIVVDELDQEYTLTVPFLTGEPTKKEDIEYLKDKMKKGLLTPSEINDVKRRYSQLDIMQQRYTIGSLRVWLLTGNEKDLSLL